MTTRGLLIGGLIALAATGCQKSLPMAPSPAEEEAFGFVGIIVYEDIDFRGDSAVITRDISDLRDFKGPCEHEDFSNGYSVYYDWNDCISSVRVAPGWSATLYRDDGYRDDRITVDEDEPDLRAAPHDCPKGGLNDCVTSIRVRPPS